VDHLAVDQEQRRAVVRTFCIVERCAIHPCCPLDESCGGGRAAVVDPVCAVAHDVIGDRRAEARDQGGAEARGDGACGPPSGGHGDPPVSRDRRRSVGGARGDGAVARGRSRGGDAQPFDDAGSRVQVRTRATEFSCEADGPRGPGQRCDPPSPPCCAGPAPADATFSSPDIKPRSRQVTDGLGATVSRGMLRAVGMGDDDWVKPQIGIASSWNEITPCNLSLDRLAQSAKEGVHSGGGYPLQFGTISVSDGISMGHDGTHYSLVSRDLIADSVETVMNAERLDGSVLLAGCDKSLPGMLMAAARLDLASVFVYAGTIMPGRVTLEGGEEKDVTIIDGFEAIGACARGLMSREDVGRIERSICPGEGACGGYYTANTMSTVAEAIGMSIPGSATPPSADRRRDADARRAGEAVVEMLRRGITSRDIMTKSAFENAIAVVQAFGGSTNAVLHLLAIAHEADV